jgi:hypothetical protein
MTKKTSGPITKWEHSTLRDRVLTAISGALLHRQRPLWFAETLVLSARYQQWLSMNEWSSGSRRHSHRLRLWQKEVEPRVRRTPTVVLEFGVGEGVATYWWSKRDVAFTAWHGFDTFSGLPSAWKRAEVPVMAAGVFRPRQPEGPELFPLRQDFLYTWHKGLIEETLPKFARPDAPLFVMVDVDLLRPTQTILDWLKIHGRPGDLLYFDEAFDPWNEGLAIRNAVSDSLSLRAIAHTGSALLTELL